MPGSTGLTVKSLLSAIRRKCLDCTGGSREEVENCPVSECPLHSFRLAKEQGVLPGTPSPAETA